MAALGCVGGVSGVGGIGCVGGLGLVGLCWSIICSALIIIICSGFVYKLHVLSWGRSQVILF